MRVGVLTGGGDCPGLNAVIRAVTKSLIHHGPAEVWGIEDGFEGLIEGRGRPLDWDAVSGIIATGGTILGTSNRGSPLSSEQAMSRALAHARQWGLQAIVAIGGDGTMSIAHAMAARGLPFVGVPKTIDNDIEGCERSFGFDTAVSIVSEALERVQTTGQSHGRVMIVETMGRYAGWIALEAGVAAAADVILLPEIEYDVQAVAEVCRRRETARAGAAVPAADPSRCKARQRCTVICIAEGARARGQGYTVERRVTGADDPLRLGGVAHVLRDQLQPLIGSEVRATVLGHVQRGGSPTPFDRVLATQYGHHAARLVLQGAYGRMVTLANGHITSVPIEEVAGRNRRVPADHPLLLCAREIGVSFGEAPAAG